MDDDTFAQAVALLEGHGINGVTRVIINGIRRVPPGRCDLLKRWEDIAEHIDEIASATRH